MYFQLRWIGGSAEYTIGSRCSGNGVRLERKWNIMDSREWAQITKKNLNGIALSWILP